jgi:hypothetical protein
MPPELVDAVPYFKLAYYFGWDKDTVDRQDAEHVEKLLLMLDAVTEAEAESLKEVKKCQQTTSRLR